MRRISIVIATLFVSSCLAQPLSFSKKAQQLIGVFDLQHISPPKHTAQTSTEIVDLFVSDLDNTGLILKQNDVTALKKDGEKLLEQISSLNNDYAMQAEQVFTKALKTTDSILQVISTKPLGFSENDTLFFLPLGEKSQYSPNLKVHARRLEKIVKYRCCEKVANTESYQTLQEKEFSQKAQQFLTGIIDNLRKSIKLQIGSTGPIVESTLLNAIALRYDPHSNYFTQEQNKQFSQQLSSKVETFGIQLEENENNDIVIARIEPGSSAWLSNDINEGDLFISVKIGSVLMANGDATVYDVQSVLDNSSEKNMLFTLKKPNGLIKKVKLVKQKINYEGNSVKGYVLNHGGMNLGYLSLPSFYTDMEDHNLPGCANDVAKEILKLEKDSIQGLILDLRNNGGGSMYEAVSLAGVFIDEGPLFIYQEKNRKPVIIKDINRGSLFKKPIVVMINEASASASELFGNIVQDYRLGVVVGQSSYGKGTAQNIQPLDSNVLRSPNHMKTNQDFIKITTGKFYKLNCSTHQGCGVTPDITLPSFAGYARYKESKELYYLPPDSVSKKVVYKPNPPVMTEALRSRSKSRVESSEEFRRYRQISDSLTQRLNSVQKVPLNYTGYKKYKAESDAGYLAYENCIAGKANTISCRNNTFDKDLNEVNPQVKEFNAKIRRSVEQDIFINESFEILKDIINP